MPNRPISEILFEKYLTDERISFEYEKTWSHTNKKPDYTILHNNEEIVLDITEINFDERQPITDFGEVLKKFKTSAIRSKISKKAIQLADFVNNMSVVIIYSPDHTFWFTDPDHVYESLYGDLAIISTYHKETGYIIGSDRWTYTDYGKFDDNRNTNLSAVITLRKIDNNNLGVIVFENYYATTSLPRDIFCGVNDIRYAIEENKLKQIFIGSNLISTQEKHIELIRFLQ